MSMAERTALSLSRDADFGVRLDDADVGLLA